MHFDHTHASPCPDRSMTPSVPAHLCVFFIYFFHNTSIPICSTQTVKDEQCLLEDGPSTGASLLKLMLPLLSWGWDLMPTYPLHERIFFGLIGPPAHCFNSCEFICMTVQLCPENTLSCSHSLFMAFTIFLLPLS